MKYSLKVMMSTALLFLASQNMAFASEKIGWKDLVPEGFTPPPVKPQSYYDQNPEEAEQKFLDAPVVQALDGKKVKIPGYVVQLEGNADAVTEFLLVPYFGACIHVPPPPPNQIIHVKFEEGVPYENTYDAVWVEGTISTQRTDSDLAVTGYSMKADSVTVYQ
ncbi:DUF3299 domain-containing protein [Idiomarina baltica]|jgi:hypothetical protein|uniref:Uncharacterized conserved secreted protein n=2 Tax=Idiomarina baltica TaxID=190892 RepID=A0ABM9WN36_9GAMM|nr:Uncharacterized conserved secreted protein [Idiomarina baltica OS145]KXS36132.1 MAG: putative conserved secreted protein [Idiomarina sp. T82-3]|tara:strand:- start:241 stop:729 length:489 start_codon:yes stop_codon:yes gene_type:complete